MAPDLNSLPPSRASSRTPTLPSPAAQSPPPPTMATSSDASLSRRDTPSPSSRTAATSLQAAAAMNAGLQHEDSRRSSVSSTSRSRQSPHAGRRRSTVLMSLQLSDPNTPAAGEMVTGDHPASPQPLTASPLLSTADPHHRAPSLGELHQELEQEQEAHVNRLLQMIRVQQQQIMAYQNASGQTPTAAVVDDSTPTSERSLSFPSVITQPVPRSPTMNTHPRSSFDLARADIQRRSRTPSRTASPRLRASSIHGEGESFALTGRDESAFYQAETQMLVRENQMLRMRIRELERQVLDLHTNASITHEPSNPSLLLRAQSVSELAEESGAPSITETAGASMSASASSAAPATPVSTSAGGGDTKE